MSSKPLFDPTVCEGTECPAGCCPGENWFCCPDNIYCASTAADCPSAAADITGEPTTIAGVAFDPADFFDTSLPPMRFISGATAGEFVVPEWLGFNRAVYINSQGGITDEYVAPRQIIRFYSTIVLGYDPAGSQSQTLPDPPEFTVELTGNPQEVGSVYTVTVDPVAGATGYVFRFNGVAIRPDRIGPSSEYPDHEGKGELVVGQYQYFGGVEGQAMTAASTNGQGTGSSSEPTQIGKKPCDVDGDCGEDQCCVDGKCEPCGKSSSSSSSQSSSFEVLSSSIAKQSLYGTITTVEVPTDGKVVDTEFYGSVTGGSDVVEMASTEGIYAGMAFSVQGDCAHDEIIDFSSEVVFVERGGITLKSPIPGSESCASAAILITGPEVPVFEFDGGEVRPDRVGPSSGHPDGYPDIDEGQHQFFYDFGGSELRVSRQQGGSFSSPVYIQSLGSSSSSSYVMPEVFRFWELEVEVDGSEFITVAVADPQLSTQIEIADKIQVLNQCYYVGADQSCPEGYFDNGLVEPCGEFCDKVCCPEPDFVSSPMVCGRVYSGNGGYNAPWQFHIDPDTVRLSYKSGLTDDSNVDLSPSSIEASLGSSLAEGSECCFPIRDRARLMEVIGVDQCHDPLSISAERSLDENSGTYVINSVCVGDCEKVEGSYCLDYEMQEYDDELQSSTDETYQKFEQMDDDELAAWFLEDHVSLFDSLGIDPDGDYTEEQMLELIEAMLESSSSSSGSSSSSSSSSQPMNFRGSWLPFVAYMKNDVVEYSGTFYVAIEDMLGEYAIGSGPENWIQCPDSSTYARLESDCPGYSNFNPKSFVEGWRIDLSRESYLPKSFDSESDDVSTNPSDPAPFALTRGDNYLIASVGGSKAETYFSFEVGQNVRVTKISVPAIGAEVDLASVELKEGAEWDSGTTLGESSFGINLNKNLLGPQLPLESGFYCLKVSSPEAEFDYALIFVLE